MEENKMGVMPIDKLIISMSLPIMISMLVQALYNIVDSIFVAMISENALTAVSMAFPIQNLMIAVGVGTAVGVNALLARSLGEKDTEKVNKVAENAVFLILVSYLLFLIIGLFFAEPFFRSQTDIEEIIVYGKQYLTICCCLSFGIFTQLSLSVCCMATGKILYHVYTGCRCDHQYRSRSGSHLWSVWSPENGHFWCCCCNRHRTDDCRYFGSCFKPHKK